MHNDGDEIAAAADAAAAAAAGGGDVGHPAAVNLGDALRIVAQSQAALVQIVQRQNDPARDAPAEPPAEPELLVDVASQWYRVSPSDITTATRFVGRVEIFCVDCWYVIIDRMNLGPRDIQAIGVGEPTFRIAMRGHLERLTSRIGGFQGAHGNNLNLILDHLMTAAQNVNMTRQTIGTLTREEAANGMDRQVMMNLFESSAQFLAEAHRITVEVHTALQENLKLLSEDDAKFARDKVVESMNIAPSKYLDHVTSRHRTIKDRVAATGKKQPHRDDASSKTSATFRCYGCKKTMPGSEAAAHKKSCKKR